MLDGKPQPLSKAQMCLMRAVASSDSLAAKLGMDPAVAREFVAGDHGKNIKKRPDHVKSSKS